MIDANPSGLEVRVIGRIEGRKTKTYSFILSHPSELEFLWFEIKEGSHIAVGPEKADELWESYYSNLRGKIDKFKDMPSEGLSLDEIASVLGLSQNTTTKIRNGSASEYGFDVPTRKTTGKVKSLTKEFLSYMLAYYSPVLENWVESTDLAKEIGVYAQTISAQCRKGNVEARKVLGKWYLSESGELIARRRLNPAKLKEYVMIIDGRDYYSARYAGRELARLNGFKEGTKEFKQESGRLRKKVKYRANHSTTVKTREINGEMCFDRENLDLVCDLITVEEASELVGASVYFINQAMGLRKGKKTFKTPREGAELPAVLVGNTYYTRRSAAIEYRRNSELAKPAETHVVVKTVESRLHEEKYSILKAREEGLRARVKVLEEQAKTASIESEKNYSDDVYGLQREIVRLKIFLGEQQRSFSHSQEDLESEIRELEGRVEEQTQLVVELQRRIAVFQRRYRKETKGYFKELYGTVDRIVAAMEKGKTVKEGEGFGRFISYLDKASILTPSMVPEDSEFKPVAVAQMSAGVEARTMKEQIVMYQQTGKEAYVKSVMLFMKALSQKLAERCE